MRIRPFAASRPRAGLEGTISAPPYDVLSTADAVRLADGAPDSILHVTRPDILASAGASTDVESLYRAARAHYRNLVNDGRLVVEKQRRYYLYEQELNGLRQRGVVALFHVDDYRQGVIRRHETTRRDKERDRTRLLRVVNAQPGLVFLACRANAALSALLADTPSRWIYDFKAADGAVHRVSTFPDDAAVEAALAEDTAAYIADGHHRAAAAAGVAAIDNDPAAESAWFPAALFPADMLHVFAYHRCVRSLGRYDVPEFLEAIGQRFDLTPADPATVPERGTLRLQMLEGSWDLRVRCPLKSDSITDRLDVAVLQDHLLHPVLGIDDPRADQNLDFIGGAGAETVIADRLANGTIRAAFRLAPVAVDQMMDVADRGESMPPKSTWFEPKLLEGLLIHDRGAVPLG